MKRFIFAIIAGLLLSAGITTVALAQWPTTCVEATMLLSGTWATSTT